jgi:hypothetical protein
MAKMIKKHAMEMFEKGDKDHINAMNKMEELMNDPKAMKEWMNNKKKEFDSLSQ